MHRVPGMIPGKRRLVRDIESVLHVFGPLLAFFALYRWALWSELFTAATTPRLILPHGFAAWEYVRCSMGDVVLTLLVSLPVGVAVAVADRFRRPALPAAARLATCVIFMAIGVVSAIHLRLLFTVGTGLDYDALVEAGGPESTWYFLGYAHRVDLALALGAPLLYLASLILPPGWRRARDLAAAVAVFDLCIVWLLTPPSHLPAELRLNPIQFTAGTVLATRGRSAPKYIAGPLPIRSPQRGSLRLTGPDFRGMPRFTAAPPLPDDIPGDLNVLLVIMESVGTRYIFDTSLGNPEPMPFLRHLASNGWYLENHHTTGNASMRALFSIMSGLYPATQIRPLCTQRQVVIPSLRSFLDARYDTFVVTPGKLTGYFPRRFLHNSGIAEMYGSQKLRNIPPAPRGPSESRNELAVFRFFEQRFASASNPFFAIYHSFVPHWPYHDYGDAYRILSEPRSPMHRYYNNLRLLDTLIERMVRQLEKQGRLEDTVIILAADHGEAFEQHPGNRLHGGFLYEENLRAPVVFYNRRIFKPRRIREPTSHVDILPTLLEVLGIPYNPALFQGESLWKKTTDRKYLFAVGSRAEIASLSRDGVKMIVSHHRNSCEAYALKRDPDERTPLPCESYASQLDALLEFASFQAAALREFNGTLRQGTPFHGKRHPGSLYAAQTLQ